ncbi:hypothetical protein FRC02_001902 [Tulasnella sp. 418]|nr:hypothetical protein FRC02_001902 [Tulasnella sp. 418]
MSTPLIGSVVERNPSNAKFSFKSQSTPDPSTGFPPVQHRSKSAFARAREAARKETATSRHQQVPQPDSISRNIATESHSDGNAEVQNVDNDQSWRKQMSDENARRVENMSQAEREEERAELLERLGPGAMELLKKIKERREASGAKPLLEATQESSDNNAQTAAPETVQDVALTLHAPSPEAPRRPLYIDTVQQSSPSRPNSPRPSSFRSATPKTGRKLRFSSSPAEVHVYESQPSSPKRPVALLPPPPALHDTTDGSTPTISYDASAFLKNSPSVQQPEETDLNSPDTQDQDSVEDEEEGSPEYIRKRYFPDASPDNPSLEWMKGKAKSHASESLSASARYNLTGDVLPPNLSATLPTHLGLHHHAGDQAGYTLDELLTLARSTVPAQRASMLGVLGKILSRAYSSEYDESLHGISISELRSRILAVGVEALTERGSVGVQAVHVVWTAVVGKNHAEEVGSSEETLRPLYAPEGESDPFGLESIIPLPHFLRALTTQLHPSAQTLPQLSLVQILQIVVHLARFASAANEILKTPDLLPSVLQTFIVSASAPSPLAITLVSLIARVSRANAKSVIDTGMVDTFLRFVLVAGSHVGHDGISFAATAEEVGSLALLVETLGLYNILGRYGMYSHIATTTSQSLRDISHIASHLLESVPGFKTRQNVLQLMTRFVVSWLELLETWIVCAIDPHQTTPPHDLLWSQISGLGWVDDVLRLRRQLLESGDMTDDFQLEAWSGVRNVLTAWLEGWRVNGVKGGEKERLSGMKEVMDNPAGLGEEEAVLLSATDRMATLLEGNITRNKLREISRLSAHINSALALVYQCAGHPRSHDQPPPPSTLPFFESSHSRIRGVCKQLLEYTLLETPHDIDFARPLTTLLVVDTKLQAQLIQNPPNTGDPTMDYLTQTAALLPILGPGDEQFALDLVLSFLTLASKEFFELKWQVGPRLDEVWATGGLALLAPFLENAIRPSSHRRRSGDDDEVQPDVVGTWRPTPRSISEATTLIVPPKAQGRPSPQSGLPLMRDWPFVPLNDLLRSGNSAVFRNLPDDWDKSETDIVRATLLLARMVQGLSEAGRAQLMRREEVVFGCMKVFMLEQGQGSASSIGNDSSTEVFRDLVISALMEQLIEPFKVRRGVSDSSSRSSPARSPTLEQVGLPFLGSTTPFYQFYTDFVGLYDSISFGHPTFGSLLIPPLAMHYAIDYRRLLWGDYSHLLRSLTIEAPDVIGDSPGDWLFPAESNGEMIGFYVKALGNPRVRLRGFLRWVAVHHVACNIWSDLQLLGDVGMEAGGRDRAKGQGYPMVKENPKAPGQTLLLAVLGNTPLEAVREVVLYRYSSVQLESSLDECVNQTGEWRKQRMDWVQSWAPPNLCDRLRGLFDQM